jgi:hypothetical protein
MPIGIGGEQAWYCPSLDDSGNGTTTLTDLSDNGNHGTLVNMDPDTDWVEDTDNGGARALDFDGVNDYVNCGLVSGMQTTGNASVTCWVLPRSLSSFRGVVTRTNNGDVGFQLAFAGTSIRWPVYNSPLFSTVSTGIWYHVCGVSRDGKQELWINGVKTGEMNGTNGATAVNAVIGRLYANADSFYSDMLLDDTRMFARDLSVDEISALSSQRGYQPVTGKKRPRVNGSLINSGLCRSKT